MHITRVEDLSHRIATDMPVYPGTEPPAIRAATSIERDGFAETWLGFYSHTGTHVDAPAHILPGARSLADFPASHFVGKATVIQVPAGTKTIPVSMLQAAASRIAICDFLLFNTGWDQYWGSPAYFKDFPVLEENAARWLASHHIRGAGFDCISADPVDRPELSNHRILLGAGFLIIENLCGLERVGMEHFTFACLPLNYANSDGSPVRAVAILGESETVMSALSKTGQE